MQKNNQKSDYPKIIKGDVYKDKRGIISFVNVFDFPKIKRFYVIENSRKGLIRAWHGHKYEKKYAFVLTGQAQVAVVKIDNWKNPDKKTKVHTFLLSSEQPSILYIPNGYANGFKSITKDAKILFFSTSTLKQSQKDDFRFEPNYWDIWSKSD